MANSDYRSAITSSLITACICFSVVVVTGYVGQISLAQNALAGVSAFMVTHIAAVRSNERAAASIGIDVARTKLMSASAWPGVR